MFKIIVVFELGMFSLPMVGAWYWANISEDLVDHRWREGIIIYERTSHSSNLKAQNGMHPWHYFHDSFDTVFNFKDPEWEHTRSFEINWH